MKHTQGKWQVDKDGLYITDFQERIIAECDMGIGLPPKEKEANARLIASAPELLEACKNILYFLKSNGYDTRIIEQAIAKAEGR